MRARGGDLMPETVLPFVLLIMRSDPERILVNADAAVTKSIPSQGSVGERYEIFLCFHRHNPIL